MDAYATTISDVALVNIVVGVTLVGLFTATLVVVQRRFFRMLGEHYRREVQSAQDRMSIACDLHDQLCPMLASATLDLAFLKEDEPRLEKRIGEIEQKVDSVAEGFRLITHGLAPPALMKNGLEAEIVQYVEEMERRYPIRFDVRMSPLKTALRPEVPLLLWPILREVIYNAVRHSGCDKITLEMAERKQQLSVICRDNGKGFDWNHAKRGLGLTSIEARLHEAGGTMHHFSSAKEGTFYRFDIPIRKTKWKRLK